MLWWYSVWYFVEVHELQTEFNVLKQGVSLILGHGVERSSIT